MSLLPFDGGAGEGGRKSHSGTTQGDWSTVVPAQSGRLPHSDPTLPAQPVGTMGDVKPCKTRVSRDERERRGTGK